MSQSTSREMGHTAAALRRLKEVGAENIKFGCLLAASEGIAAVHAEHPEIQIFVGAIDEHGYIVPGLGDAGDRLIAS